MDNKEKHLGRVAQGVENVAETRGFEAAGDTRFEPVTFGSGEQREIDENQRVMGDRGLHEGYDSAMLRSAAQGILLDLVAGAQTIPRDTLISLAWSALAISNCPVAGRARELMQAALGGSGEKWVVAKAVDLAEAVLAAVNAADSARKAAS